MGGHSFGCSPIFLYLCDMRNWRQYINNQHNNHIYLLVCLFGILACSKLENNFDIVEQNPTIESESKKPSKYKEDDLVSMVFSVEEPEAAKVSLGAPGSGSTGGSSRRVSWDAGDSIMFVWGPDAEDCCIGVALKTDVKTDFKVERIFKDAKTVYAVTPASAYHSFVKSANWDEDGTGTVKVDTRKQGGSFEDAYIAVARTSLASRKMSFKALFGYVVVNPTHPIAGGFKLDGGSTVLSGIIPINADMAGDYTGELNIGEFEEASTVVTANCGSITDKVYMAVLPGAGFKDGITLSFLDAYGASISTATLTHNTSIEKNKILEFKAEISDHFKSKDYYVKVGGSGSKNGSSWDNAWDLAGLTNYLATADGYDAADLPAHAPINIHIAAGRYEPSSYMTFRARYTDSSKSEVRSVNLFGGYPSDIMVSNAGDRVRDPKTYETIFSGKNLPTGANDQYIFYMNYGGKFSLSGLTICERASKKTSRPAISVWSTDIPSQFSMHGCKITGNTNTNVSAGILVNSYANRNDVLIENCEFTGNTAGAGGALSITGVNTYTTVRNCRFENNQITHYANHQDGGAAVKVEGGHTSIFEDCTFVGNQLQAGAIGNGAGVWIIDGHKDNLTTRSVRFTRCRFEKNSTNNAVSKGAAVWVQRTGKATFEDCIFDGNLNKGRSTTNDGGAVLVGGNLEGDQNFYTDYAEHDYNVAVEMNRCDFYNNNTGSIVLENITTTTKTYASSLDITGGSFYGNTISYNGGVIWAKSGSLEIQGASFSENILNTESVVSGQNWSALYLATRSTLNNCLFKENEANFGGALCIQLANASTAQVTNCHFTNNSGRNGGGAIFIPQGNSGDITIYDCHFSNNQCYASGGGAVRIASNHGKTISISNSVFENNIAALSGGAIVNYQNANLTISDCQFKQNSCTTGLGGAIFTAGENGCQNTLSVSGSHFEKNKASNRGGAICINRHGVSEVCLSNLSISNSYFLGNYGSSAGGAISFESSGTANISGCEFNGNYTTGKEWTASGGALHLDYGNTGASGTRSVATISQCKFIGNYTGLYETKEYEKARGGAIAICRKETELEQKIYMDVRINGCYFSGNYATQGGAILAQEGYQSTLYLNNCAFEGNWTQINYGTTLFVYKLKEFCMNNCSFRNSWMKIDDVDISNAQWISECSSNMLMSNCSVMGQVQKKDADGVTSTNGSLIRIAVEKTGTRYDFINNIIASPASWCRSITAYRGNNSLTYALNLYSNKMSPHYSIVREYASSFNTDSHNALNFYMNGFGSLAWNNTDDAAYNTRYWAWNGTLTTGSPTTMNILSDVNSKIQSANANFYSWLQSVGGHDKDQRGTTRSATTWPGAYQGK